MAVGLLAFWHWFGLGQPATPAPVGPEAVPSAMGVPPPALPVAQTVVSVEEVSRWTNLLNKAGAASVRRGSENEPELFRLESRGALSELGIREVRRKLQSAANTYDRDLLAAQVEANTELGRAIRMATLVLMKKDILLALQALEEGSYVTGELVEIRRRLPKHMKLIECGGQVLSGQWTRVGLVANQKFDPEYEPILRVLESVAESDVATRVAAFNARPLAERQAAHDRIVTCRAALDEFRASGSSDPQKYYELSASWVSAMAVLPHQAVEFAPISYHMVIR